MTEQEEKLRKAAEELEGASGGEVGIDAVRRALADPPPSFVKFRRMGHRFTTHNDGARVWRQSADGQLYVEQDGALARAMEIGGGRALIGRKAIKRYLRAQRSGSRDTIAAAGVAPVPAPDRRKLALMAEMADEAIRRGGTPIGNPETLDRCFTESNGKLILRYTTADGKARWISRPFKGAGD